MPVSQAELDRSLELLHVSENSSWDDIQKQYRLLVQQWHPDRHQGDQSTDAHAKFIEITGAYKLLREYHKQVGSVPRHSAVNSNQTLNPANTSSESSKSKLGWLQMTIISLTALIIIAAVLWQLDKRQIQNNRDRSHTISTHRPF
ncbi:MAG: J domain-containing protein [Granulosicoccaceae bacterium]